MKKQLRTIFILMTVLLSVKSTRAQYVLTASQITNPTALNNAQQVCIGFNNVAHFDGNNNQVFFIDSIKYGNPPQTMINIYTRDSTSLYPGPYTTTNYNFCLSPKQVGTYNMSMNQLWNMSIAYPLPNFNLNVVCNGSPSSTTINLNGCDSVIHNSQTYYSSTTVVDSLSDANSCDSVVTTIIVINSSDLTTVITDTICSNSTYTLPNNTTISNLQNDTLIHLNFTNQGGCDSNFAINIKVESALDTTITQAGSALYANQPNANYVWYDCDSNQIISGQTNQFYSPSQSGDFACIISKGVCLDTTVCFNYLTTAINDYSLKNRYKIYPNPNNGNFILTAEKLTSITIFNSVGELIYDIQNTSLTNSLQLERSAKGIYFIKMTFKNGSSSAEKILIK
jgi:hypothetical protein